MRSFELFRDSLGGRVLGVEVDREYLQYLVLEKKAGRYIVHNFGRRPYQEATDIGEGLQQAIPELFGKESAFQNARLILGVAEEGLHIKIDSLPPLAAKELAQSIHMDVEREMGAEGNIVFGYKKLGPDKKKPENSEYIAVGMYEEDLNHAILPFVRQGVVPVKVMPRLLALSNLMPFLPQEMAMSPVGMLHIGAKRSVLAIFQEGKLDFHRDMVMGGDDFVKAITGTIFHEGKAIQFTFQEAAEIKNKYGYPLGFEAGQSFKGAPVSELGAMMRPVMERLTGEIQRSLGFYADKNNGEAAQTLYLVGPGANMHHLDEVLSDRLKIQVARMPMPKNLRVASGPEAKKIFKQKFIEQAVCLALASETDKHSTNLLPQSYKKQAQLNVIARAALALTGVLLLIAAFFCWSGYATGRQLKRDVEIARKRALEAERSENRYARAVAELGQANAELASLKERVLQDEELVQILRLFSNRLPQNMVLASFQYEWEEVKQQASKPAPRQSRRAAQNEDPKEDTSPAVPKRLFGLTGTSANPPPDVKILLAGFMIDMQKSGYFSTIEVIRETLNPDGDLYEFEIKGVFAGGGDA